MDFDDPAFLLDGLQKGLKKLQRYEVEYVDYQTPPGRVALANGRYFLADDVLRLVEASKTDRQRKFESDKS